MRILITSDRHWRCDDLAEQILGRLLARYGPGLVIIHGGAAGVDNSFAMACENLGITTEPELADWKGLGNVAGPIRNREMFESGADSSRKRSEPKSISGPCMASRRSTWASTHGQCRRIPSVR
jgi:hypothetical protein